MADATIVFNQTWQQQQVRNVTVWSNVLADESELKSFADNLKASYLSNNVNDIMSNDWSLDSLTVIFNDTTPVYSINIPFSDGPLYGLNVSNAMPAADCLLVSTRYFGPPPNRGRIYFPGICASGLVDGVWSGTILDNFEVMVTGWGQDGIDSNSSTFFLRIARRNANGTIATSNGVSAALAQGNPATQRRRRIGVGS